LSSRVEVKIDRVEPARPSERDLRMRKLLYFLLANLIALAIAGGIFGFLMFGIPEGRGFDQAMAVVRRFLRSHMSVAALAASLPFFASLLVGQYEMRRARARRRRQEAEERRARIERELAEQRLAREQRAARR
jgi:hypothetical protein